MSNKQKIAIAAPITITATMIPMFQILAGKLGSFQGWYLGLVAYWLIWGAIFSVLIIGKQRIRILITPRRGNLKIVALVAFPLLMAFISKFLPGMEYKKESTWTFLLLLTTAFGNGFFEEILWRGVYMTLFPRNLWLRIVWPSIWFALWHYAPGSINPNSCHVFALMAGALFLGVYAAIMAKCTHTLCWSIIISELRTRFFSTAVSE